MSLRWLVVAKWLNRLTIISLSSLRKPNLSTIIDIVVHYRFLKKKPPVSHGLCMRVCEASYHWLILGSVTELTYIKLNLRDQKLAGRYWRHSLVILNKKIKNRSICLLPKQKMYMYQLLKDICYDDDGKSDYEAASAEASFKFWQILT